RRSAPLAARGNAAGLRLLAVTLDSRPGVTMALDREALKRSEQIPYRILAEARRGNGLDQIALPGEIKPLGYSDARYQELRGLLLEKQGSFDGGILRFAVAQQLYLQNADNEGANAAGSKRLKLARNLADAQLIAAWETLRAAAPSQVQPDPKSE